MTTTTSTKPLFVRIKCQLGMTYKVALNIMDTIEETSAVYSTAGPFDLLAKFDIPVERSIGQFINDTLHHISGIVDTDTLIVFSAFGKNQNDDAIRLQE